MAELLCNCRIKITKMLQTRRFWPLSIHIR